MRLNPRSASMKPAAIPVKGYSLARKTGDFMQVSIKVDEETIEHRGYVFSVDSVNGKNTLQKIAFGNGEMILIKPENTTGFSLKKGETISLFALLNTDAKYADKAGEIAQVGCFLNGDVYETFTGKLPGGGVVFEIEAPCDGEFLIYITNYCAGLQNYAELSVY